MFTLSSTLFTIQFFLIIKVDAFCTHVPLSLSSSWSSLRSNSRSDDSAPTISNDDRETMKQRNKEQLLDILSTVPPNQPTSKPLTNEILTSVSNLEPFCPTDDQFVLEELNGNWELLWTAQDQQQQQNNNGNGIFGTWINPLENQSYSNNPSGRSIDRSGGRSNPILPQNIQDTLEDIGLLINDDGGQDSTSVKSIQAIDGKKGRVRNVVSVLLRSPLSIPFSPKSSKNNRLRGSLTVDISYTPNKLDTRKIDVKFDMCRVSFQKSSITIPLGPIGPNGEF